MPKVFEQLCFCLGEFRYKIKRIRKKFYLNIISSIVMQTVVLLTQILLLVITLLKVELLSVIERDVERTSSSSTCNSLENELVKEFINEKVEANVKLPKDKSQRSSEKVLAISHIRRIRLKR